MATSVIDAATLERRLGQLLESNSATIHEAEAAIKKALGKPAVICDLFGQLQNSPHVQIRQLAAVLMRRRVGAHWLKLEAPVRQQLQAGLLARLGAEPERIVRRSMASVVAVVSRHALPKGEWPELFAFIFQCSQSGAAEHRELSMLLLASLMESEEVVDVALRPHFELLRNTLAGLLADKESAPVRQAALKAVGAWASAIMEDDDAAIIKPLIPPMIELARGAALTVGAAGTSDEDSLVLALGILYDLFEASTPVVSGQLPAILALATDAAVAAALEPETRCAALNLIAAALGTQRKAIVKKNLVGPIAAKLFEAAIDMHSPAEEEADGDDDDDTSIHRRACQVLHLFAVYLPSKHAVGPVLEQVRLHFASESVNARRAALVALAVTTEGFQEPYAKQLEHLLPIAYAGCKDPVQAVREAACIAIGSFAQGLQPEIIEHYEQVLPHIFMVLNDATDQVKEKSCQALEAFCENLDKDIVPFLPQLISKLVELLQTSTVPTQQMAISALASVAMAAGEDFRPYFEQVYGMLRVLLSQTGDTELLLRARAMECLGLMFLAVGREVCESVLHECTAGAMAGLELELPELREYTYGFFAQLAELIGPEVGPLLPALMPRLIASLECDDTIEVQDNPADGMKQILAGLNSQGDGGADSDDDGDDDDSDDEGGGPKLSIRTALLDEKAAAAHCLGACAKHGAAAFAPQIGTSLEPLLAAADYFHEDVRGAVAHALAHLIISAHAAEAVRPWVKGELARPEMLPEHTRALLGRVLPALLERFEEDDDKDVVAAASEALAEVASTLGPAAVLGVVTKLVATAVELLEQKHPCMNGFDDDLDGIAGIDDDADHDASLWEAISELLTTLPKVLGDAWVPHFNQLVPVLLPYLGPGHPSNDRSLAIGVLAETLSRLEGAALAFAPHVLPHALRCASDDDVTTRQNGTFCLGVIGLYGGPAAFEAMQPILTAIQPRLAPDEDECVRDNAVGALSRLVLAFGSTLPLAELLPAILAHLPLKGDSSENVPAVRCLMKLAHDEATRVHLAPHLPQLLAVVSRLLTVDAKLATDELQAEIRQFLQWLLALAPELRAQLPAELQ